MIVLSLPQPPRGEGAPYLDTRHGPLRKLIVEKIAELLDPGRELPSRSRILNVLSVARVSESRRARDNNFRTVSAVNLASELVPHLHMRQFLLWAKSVRDWQPISDLTGVTKRECTRSHAHTYERAPISIRAHTSPMPARFLQPPFFISISPPNARHGVAFRRRDWRRAGTTGDFQYVLTSRNNFS